VKDSVSAWGGRRLWATSELGVTGSKSGSSHITGMATVVLVDGRTQARFSFLILPDTQNLNQFSEMRVLRQTANVALPFRTTAYSSGLC